jgi:putative addiction module component (TIGR02574 family)
MPYNKEELMKLSAEEKIQLIEELMESVEDKENYDREHLINVARERYQDYLKNPGDVMSWEEVKRLFREKYGV